MCSSDLIDPENRNFRHPDPIGWTRTHRSKILQAMYVILLGNPTLDLPRDASMKTRFKMWYRLIGSAIEHAAQCAVTNDPDRDHIPDQALDFSSMFLKQEADDEDSTSLAEMLYSLDKGIADRDAALGRPKQARREFKAVDVADMINASATNTDTLTIRDFLFQDHPSEAHFTPKAVAKRLKKHVGKPVRHGEQTLALKAYDDKHDKVLKFYVASLTHEEPKA